MKVVKINDLLTKTQQATNYPPHVIADVINHQFSFLREFLMYPTHAGIRYKYLGVFRPRSIKAVSLYISALISLYRKYKNPTVLSRIRYYWVLRRLLQKDIERRKFKKRFGK